MVRIDDNNDDDDDGAVVVVVIVGNDQFHNNKKKTIENETPFVEVWNEREMRRKAVLGTKMVLGVL